MWEGGPLRQWAAVAQSGWTPYAKGVMPVAPSAETVCARCPEFTMSRVIPTPAMRKTVPLAQQEFGFADVAETRNPRAAKFRNGLRWKLRLNRK
jgi:hypothetical protein